MNTKTPLGRGLSSLIPNRNISNPSQPPSNQLNQKQTTGLQYLPISSLKPNPFQPRYEFKEEELANLAQSIKDKGILQPLLVTISNDGTYELVAGERRLRASKMAGLEQVPVIIRDHLTDLDKAELAIIENIQRQDLNPIEKARGFKELQDRFKMTQEQIAHNIDISRSSIANSLRLLTLPDSVQEAVSQSLITEGHAKVIAGLNDPKQQEKILKKILEYSLNVRDTEKIIKRDPNELDSVLNNEVKNSVSYLSERIKNKVELRKRGKKYVLTMHFFSEDDIQNFCRNVS